MRDLGLIDDLAWVVQCMETSPNTPTPSINCWIISMDGYLGKKRDTDAWQIAFVSCLFYILTSFYYYHLFFEILFNFFFFFSKETTERSLNNMSKLGRDEVIQCWHKLFHYYSATDNLRVCLFLLLL